MSNNKSEKRLHERLQVEGLQAIEKQNDFIYSLEVQNISEGGFFAKNKLHISDEPSSITLNFKRCKNFLSKTESESSIEILAQSLRDELKSDGNFGAGYCFLHISDSQKSKLKNLLEQSK